MTKRTWAKIGFAALALLLIVFAADIVLLVFASILLAILLRSVYVEDTLGERDAR